MAEIRTPPLPNAQRIATGREPAYPAGFSRRGFMWALASITPAYSWPALSAYVPANEVDRALKLGGENLIFGEKALGF